MKTLLNTTKTEQQIDVDVCTEKAVNIVLYNDDVHSFEEVIEALIKVCRHEKIQAEQCTYLVHYSGKCVVKEGAYNELKPMCIGLLDRGLSAEIE